VEKEFAMVGEGMLRDLETFDWGPGMEAGKRRVRKECREEGARQAADRALERRFGALPSPSQEAFTRARGPGELDGIMAVSLAEPKAEVARTLGAGVH
jgi:hypothetical protein